MAQIYTNQSSASTEDKACAEHSQLEARWKDKIGFKKNNSQQLKSHETEKVGGRPYEVTSAKQCEPSQFKIWTWL